MWDGMGETSGGTTYLHVNAEKEKAEAIVDLARRG